MLAHFPTLNELVGDETILIKEMRKVFQFPPSKNLPLLPFSFDLASPSEDVAGGRMEF